MPAAKAGSSASPQAGRASRRARASRSTSAPVACTRVASSRATTARRRGRHRPADHGRRGSRRLLRAMARPMERDHAGSDHLNQTGAQGSVAYAPTVARRGRQPRAAPLAIGRVRRGCPRAHRRHRRGAERSDVSHVGQGDLRHPTSPFTTPRARLAQPMLPEAVRRLRVNA